MMNGMIISFGTGVMSARLEWPVDGLLLGIALTVAFALLLMGLLRERGSESVERMRPTRLRPSMPGRMPQHQAA